MNIDELFSDFQTPSQLDLKINFKKFYEDSSIDSKTMSLVGLACAESVNCEPLSMFFSTRLMESDATESEIVEAKDMAAIMGVANSYYSFRHIINKDAYNRPAGFRMRIMAKPEVGKLVHELMALAISVINGCETCIQGHEKSALEAGTTEDQVHDVARLASTIKGLEASFRHVKSS